MITDEKLDRLLAVSREVIELKHRLDSGWNQDASKKRREAINHTYRWCRTLLPASGKS